MAERFSLDMLRDALRRTGSGAGAARMLGVTRSAVAQRCKEAGIPLPRKAGAELVAFRLSLTPAERDKLAAAAKGSRLAWMRRTLTARAALALSGKPRTPPDLPPPVPDAPVRVMLAPADLNRATAAAALEGVRTLKDWARRVLVEAARINRAI